MPITYNHLYPKIYDFKNLHLAYLRALRGKRYRRDALEFSLNLEENLIILQNELIWKTYKPSCFREFYVYDPKKRLIHAPTFKDRVIHHALCNIIEPLFERKFIYDSYACRKGKGTHAAVLRTQKFMRKIKAKNSFYVLKADISKYFPSINHDILKQIIRKTITCKDTLWLIDSIIDQHKEGLPLGALTSQLFANVYLDSFDHFVKDMLGIKYYLRYMDDFVIMHEDKGFLKLMLIELEGFLLNHLALKLNPKTSIFPYAHGIDFCGYRIWPTHILPRKRNVKRARKRLQKLVKLYRDRHISFKRVKSSIVSFIGYMKHCNGYKSLSCILSETKLTL